MEKAMSTFELDHYTGFEKFEKIIPPRAGCGRNCETLTQSYILWPATVNPQDAEKSRSLSAGPPRPLVAVMDREHAERGEQDSAGFTASERPSVPALTQSPLSQG